MSEAFDEATQKELAGFLEQEQAHARLNSTIHNFTSICWDKCITGTPTTQFSHKEKSCLSNCVERFLDTSLFMVRKIAEQREIAERENAGFTS